MKLAYITLLIGMAMMVAPAARAQQPATRWGATATIGTESGLGYQLPYTAFGGGVERAILDKVEIQGEADYSPTHKLVTHDGHEIHVQGRAIAWMGDRVGLTAADDETWLATSQFSKAANHPEFGVVARLWWLGFPSRFYASYVVPEGKRPTTGALQSNRLQGVSTAIEAQGWSRVRMITTFDVLTFLDQSGAAPGLRHWEGTVTVTLRIGTKQDLNQLY
jgi:hypothetical protein